MTLRMNESPCKHCDYTKHADGGYCYMFKEPPEGPFCAQFRPGRSDIIKGDPVEYWNRLSAEIKSWPPLKVADEPIDVPPFL